MKFIVAVLCLAAVALAADYKEFVAWTIANDKVYESPEEHAARFETYKENVALINHLNRQNKGAVFAANRFADMSREEFAAVYLHPYPIVAGKHTGNVFKASKSLRAPEKKDWRDEGAVNEIKDQASCGSCWAFSAVANMEGVLKVAGKKLPILAEQQLVDCEHDCMDFPGTTEQVCDQGCNGGLMPNAFTYAIREGMMTEKDYPYTGTDGTCEYEQTKAKTHFSAWTWVDKDEKAMVDALNELGPLSVAVDATYWSYYSSGIYDSQCSSSTMNHGVSVVGYGKEGSKNYWIVRNSWGTSWGEDGYMRLVRGKNKCGISNFVCSIKA